MNLNSKVVLPLIEWVSMGARLLGGQGAASQDTLQVPPCTLYGRIPAANGLEKLPPAPRVTVEMFSNPVSRQSPCQGHRLQG